MPSPPPTPSTSPTNAAIVREFVEEVINRGRIEVADKYFWPDFIEQVPFPGQGPGIQGLQDVVLAMRRGFPDMRWVILEQLSEDDRVLTRFEWTGTHRGEFLGTAATGRPVKVWGMVIDRLVDGRIMDTRIIMDSFSLMMQLGAIPSASA